MRVVVFGATGNVGTSLLQSLEDDPQIDEVVGVARRIPELQLSKTRWVAADIRTADLTSIVRGSDAVVHLAWAIQPSRKLDVLRSVNVDGSKRVFRAVVDAGIENLIYASSVGAYSPGPKSEGVDESWPVRGVGTSFYSRHKAEVERILDGFEEEHPSVRVVRMRPGLIFKKEAASGIRRLFAGPLMPGSLMTKRLIPVVPNIERLVFQALHSYDAGEAYRLALVTSVSGAFNIAADPVLDATQLGVLLGAKPIRLPQGALRGAFATTWRLRLQPTPPGWIDLAFESPILDTTRARSLLGWVPKYTSHEAVTDLLAGFREHAGLPTPPLDPQAGGPGRIKEFLSGVGSRG
jgi:nucleoside-diphosphate-sugar epimerase